MFNLYLRDEIKLKPCLSLQWENFMLFVIQNGYTCSVDTTPNRDRILLNYAFNLVTASQNEVYIYGQRAGVPPLSETVATSENA